MQCSGWPNTYFLFRIGIVRTFVFLFSWIFGIARRQTVLWNSKNFNSSADASRCSVGIMHHRPNVLRKLQVTTVNRQVQYHMYLSFTCLHPSVRHRTSGTYAHRRWGRFTQTCRGNEVNRRQRATDWVSCWTRFVLSRVAWNCRQCYSRLSDTSCSRVGG